MGNRREGPHPLRFGIDEAGYGPLLGPLTVALVGIEGGSDPLGKLIAEAPEFLARIDDSKIVKRGPKGWARLEICALSAASALRGRMPQTLNELLGGSLPGAAGHPWYDSLDLSLPRVASAEEVERAAEALRSGLERNSAALRFASCAIRCAGDFNRRVKTLGNKARVEQEMIEGLVQAALSETPHDCAIAVDRLGGRHHYADWLSRMHPFCPVEIGQEDARESRYRIRDAGRSLSYAFVVSGEAHFAEVALASCIAKYHRELLMELFNRFWQSRHPDLRATAGYVSDGRRFLEDIEADEARQRYGDVLVRIR